MASIFMHQFFTKPPKVEVAYDCSVIIRFGDTDISVHLCGAEAAGLRDALSRAIVEAATRAAHAAEATP